MDGGLGKWKMRDGGGGGNIQRRCEAFVVDNVWLFHVNNNDFMQVVQEVCTRKNHSIWNV